MKINKKMIKKIGLGTLVMGAVLLIGNVAMAAETAVWTTLDVSGKVADNLTLAIEEELRFNDITSPELGRQHTDVSLTTTVADLLGVGLGYRNTSEGEQRVYLSLGVRLLSSSVNLDSLSKLELSDGDSLRGRTEVTATTNVAGVAPWVSNELFVDSSGITGNRASVGVTRGITDAIGVRAYYLLDSTFGDSTAHSHVMGLGVSVGL